MFRCISQLNITSINLDSSDIVTLNCYVMLDSIKHKFFLDLTYEQLNGILKAFENASIAISESVGEAIQEILEDEENIAIEMPDGDNVITTNGYDFVIRSITKLDMQYDATYKLDKFYPSKKFTYGTVDYELFIDTCKPHTLRMTQLYYSYQNAIANGYSELNARAMFDLQNDLFFNMCKSISEMWD